LEKRASYDTDAKKALEEDITEGGWGGYGPPEKVPIGEYYGLGFDVTEEMTDEYRRATGEDV
jgi:hypothetical protein